MAAPRNNSLSALVAMEKMGNSRKIVLCCILCTAPLLLLLGVTGADPSSKDPAPVYKKMRPMKAEGKDPKGTERSFDLESLFGTACLLPIAAECRSGSIGH